MRIAIPARIISEKLAAGPASAIQADRRGYCRCQAGLNGALAQPIIQPPSEKGKDRHDDHPKRGAANVGNRD